MYIHLGNGISVRSRYLIGIFDIDYCSVDKRTREFLSGAQKNGRVVDVSPGELPRSFVVTSEPGGGRVYVTNVSPSTLSRRAVQRNDFGGIAVRRGNV